MCVLGWAALWSCWFQGKKMTSSFGWCHRLLSTVYAKNTLSPPELNNKNHHITSNCWNKGMCLKQIHTECISATQTQKQHFSWAINQSQQTKCSSIWLCPAAGVQQHGASFSAGTESYVLRVPSGTQGPTGGQGNEEREHGQLQHEGQELEDWIPWDVSGGQHWIRFSLL